MRSQERIIHLAMESEVLIVGFAAIAYGERALKALVCWSCSMCPLDTVQHIQQSDASSFSPGRQHFEERSIALIPNMLFPDPLSVCAKSCRQLYRCSFQLPLTWATISLLDLNLFTSALGAGK
jgi:hypothetical protein